MFRFFSFSTFWLWSSGSVEEEEEEDATHFDYFVANGVGHKLKKLTLNGCLFVTPPCSNFRYFDVSHFPTVPDPECLQVLLGSPLSETTCFSLFLLAALAWKALLWIVE